VPPVTLNVNEVPLQAGLAVDAVVPPVGMPLHTGGDHK